MVVGTIIEGPGRMGFYTDLQCVLGALNGRELDYDWLITDLESNLSASELLPHATELEPSGRESSSWYLSGQELHRLVFDRGSPAQFIWAVLSGFEQGRGIPRQHEILPYADGNSALWMQPPRIQYPGAAVEIVCWDSSATLLITGVEDLISRFRGYFPEARDLADFNKVV
jgi:hypothetical protein